MDINIGDKFYYSGDQANPPGFGEITKINGQTHTLSMADGRTFNLNKSAFLPGVGCRLMTMKEYEDFKKIQNEKLQEMLKRLKH